MPTASRKSAPAKSDDPPVHEKRKHFHHQAHAIAFSGHLTAPFDHIIESQASCSLPIAGGHATSRVDNYNFKDLISFKAACTHVTGTYSEKDDAFFTVVSTVVEELDFLHMIKIGRLCGRVMCKHPYVNPNKKPEKTMEPSITPLGSHFENVRIAGHPVNVVLNVGRVGKLDTYSSLRSNGGEGLKVYRADGDQNGSIHLSLVERLEFENAPELEVDPEIPNEIHIDQFGTIRFAELFVDPKARRIRMLSVDLGCGNEGGSNSGCGQGGGTTSGN